MDNLLLAITSLPFFPGALTALGLIIQRHFTPPRGGRFGAECPADLERNQWPVWRGISNPSEHATFQTESERISSENG